MEITHSLDLSPAQEAQVELHSFLNVMNILVGELQLLRLDLDRPDALPDTVALADAVLQAVMDGALDDALTRDLATIGGVLRREADAVFADAPELKDQPEVVESLGNLTSIIEVLQVRLEEFRERQRTGGAWEAHDVEGLLDNFRNFFAAVETNSKGRYHIVYNIAAQEEGDYLVGLNIESAAGDVLAMPPVMQDVLRDLIANARKYTPPGGRIDAGLKQDGEELRLTVSDTGAGIPADEVEKVVDLGYRAVNMQGRKTQGGGFGLTKAYANARRLGGRMWIDSELGTGTRISIRIPVPADVA